jgi:predicted nucleotidyltransferase
VSALGYNKIMDVLSPEWIENVRVQPPGFDPVTTELLQNIIHRIVAGVQPKKIILFGSYAYGTPSPDSDLDILVIMNTSRRPAERIVEVSRYLRPRPFPMDILVRTPGEIADSIEHKDSFIQEILTNGIVLYEQR